MITFKAKTPNGEIINSALSPFSFPAGEAHTKHEDRRDLELIEIAILLPDPQSLHDDLFQLAMWANRLLCTTKSVLLLPYMPGARADRGQPFGARVYAEFIGGMGVDQVIIFDPHSKVIVDELKLWQHNEAILTVVEPKELLNAPTSKLVMPNIYDGIIAPDKGAHNRANGVAEAFGIPLYTAEKTRNFDTGKLSGFHIEGLPETGKLLVVDDICDGGGTFMGLAQASGLPKERLDLFVSHGVFSGKAAQLETVFNTVYTTNSFDSRNSSLSAVRIPVQPLLLSKVI